MTVSLLRAFHIALGLGVAGGFPLLAGTPLAIDEIQGAGHESPHVGVIASTSGFVTMVVGDGFYLQDPIGDGNIATSEGLFVFTASKPTQEVGDWVELEGTVAEFIPGGVASHNLSITQLESPTFLVPTVTPPAWQPNGGVLIGGGGRLPPSKVIDDDNFQVFDPVHDGIDFYESLEGMVVTLAAPIVISPSNARAEIYVVVDGGAGASGMSARGTLNLSPDDYNPERIQVQEEEKHLDPGPLAGNINVGDRLHEVVGVVSYDGMYEVRSFDPLATVPGELVPQVSALAAFPDRLRVASYNLNGLDPHLEAVLATDQTDGDPDDDVDDDVGNGRFASIANQIVNNLGAPDVIALQEVQDNDGAEISEVTSASVTLQTLVDAIVAAGGPSYQYLDTPGVVAATIDDNGTPAFTGDDRVINPSGGQAGGNRRNAFLYNSARVDLQLTLVINHPLFDSAPAPLMGTLLIDGLHELGVVNFQLRDRQGGASVFGNIQPASTMQENPVVNGGVDQRAAQAAAINAIVTPPGFGTDTPVVLLGDVSDPEFLSPALAFGSRFTNLTETLENVERYTALSDGTSLALDHIFVTNNLVGSSRYEVVHVNCEFADTLQRASDHDPVLATINPAIGDPFSHPFRSIDGARNNLSDPTAGMAGQPYSRTTTPDFADLLNYPRGSSAGLNPNPRVLMDSDLPSAREISNVLSKHPTGVESAARLSSWTWQWGQFIDHDFGLSGGPGPDDPREFFPIPVPLGDPDFDPFQTGMQMIPFGRSGVFGGSGITTPRETPNVITSYLDGSNVYGSDELRAVNLRSLTGGKLGTQAGPDGELPPFNLYGRGNANDLGLPPEDLLLAGDVRANEQCALTATHALFLREHNRLAEEIAARDFAGADLADPDLDAEIYQRARKFVGAFIQNITYREFLPAMLGPAALPTYTGYDANNPAILSQEFANAAYRVGHSMLTAELLRFDQNGAPLPEGHLALRHAFFNPPEVIGIGIGPYLGGLARQVQEEVDRVVIEDVRSFLFGPPGAGGLDLAALNIQRGRDHGIASYNAVRIELGLNAITSFSEISSDPVIVDGFEALYSGDVAATDLWVGGISEDHQTGSQLGETFHAVWVQQFTNLRDGDRFWFEIDPFFTSQEISGIRNTRLSDIIRRNSSARVQDDVFLVPWPRLEVTFFAFDRATNTVTLRWRSVGGEQFEIEASDDFGETLLFSTVASTTGTAGASTVTFVDPGAGGKPVRAYRVVER